MYARIARWEGLTEQEVGRMTAEIAGRSESGPPEGVPAVGLTLLSDPAGGRMTAITMFETTDDLRRGDETLNRMNPPSPISGRRVTVETYEVAAEVRLQPH